jgi:hypothetical protein
MPLKSDRRTHHRRDRCREEKIVQSAEARDMLDGAGEHANAPKMGIADFVVTETLLYVLLTVAATLFPPRG